MIEKLDRSSGSVIGFRASSVVTKADYDVMVPAIEALVAEHGKVQLLCDLTDFKWEKANAWASDARFGHEFKHKISKMAVVGEGMGQKIIAFLSDKLYSEGPTQYFDNEDAAWQWLSE